MGKVSIVVLHYPTLVGRSRLYVGKVSFVVMHYPTWWEGADCMWERSVL